MTVSRRCQRSAFPAQDALGRDCWDCGSVSVASAGLLGQLDPVPQLFPTVPPCAAFPPPARPLTKVIDDSDEDPRGEAERTPGANRDRHRPGGDRGPGGPV